MAELENRTPDVPPRTSHPESLSDLWREMKLGFLEGIADSSRRFRSEVKRLLEGKIDAGDVAVGLFAIGAAVVFRGRSPNAQIQEGVKTAQRSLGRLSVFVEGLRGMSREVRAEPGIDPRVIEPLKVLSGKAQFIMKDLCPLANAPTFPELYTFEDWLTAAKRVIPALERFASDKKVWQGVEAIRGAENMGHIRFTQDIEQLKKAVIEIQKLAPR